MNNGSSILDSLTKQNANAANDTSALDAITAQNKKSTAPSSDPILTAEQYQQQKQADPQQAPPSDTNADGTATSGDGGNWLTKALPTIGSIAAPIIGALLAPETGGASLLAGLALAGGGSAAGKLGENALEGKADLASGVADSAVSGSVGQLAGGIAGKALGAGAKAIGGIAEKGIASKGVTTAAEDALAKTHDTVNTFRGIPTALKESHNPALGLKGAQDLATASGISNTDAQGMKGVGNQVLDILGSHRDNVLANSGKINTAGAVNATGAKVAPSIEDIIHSALDNTHPVTGESIGLSRKNILGSTDQVVASGKKLVSPSNDSTQFISDAKQLLSNVINKSDADPMELLAAQQKVASQAHTLTMMASRAAENGTANAEQLAAKAGAWNDLNSHLKDTLYNRQAVNDGVSGLQGNIQAADVGGNQMLADELNKRLTGAQTGQDLSTSLSHYINMRNVGKEALKAGQDTSSAQSLSAAKLAVPGEEAAQLNLPTSKTGMIAGAAKKVLGSVGNGGATSQVASKLADTLTSASKIAPNMTNAGLIGTIGAQTVAGAPNYQQAAGTNNAVQDLALPTSSGDPLRDIMNSSNAASAPAKMALISSMFRMPGESSSNPLADPGIQDYLNNQQKLQNASAQVNDYIHSINAAGGAQGMAGGLLSQLGGAITGGPAHAAELQRAQLEQTLAQALGHPVSLPGMTMTQGGANSVLGQLQSGLMSASGQ